MTGFNIGMARSPNPAAHDLISETHGNAAVVAKGRNGPGHPGHSRRLRRAGSREIALQLRLPLWAVLTAIIVRQMSVGRSLKATRDYFIGTIGGAIYGGAIAILIPHSGESGLLAVR